MIANRYKNNPLITPNDVKPHRDDFEVIGAFNAGVTEFNGETILLLRVAERPICDNNDIVKVPIYNVEKKELDIIELRKDDEQYDFSDSRTIADNKSGEKFKYLTSLSYIRIARSSDGINFTVDDEPFIYPSKEDEIYGIEDPRITFIDDTYYIYFSSVSPVGVGESMVSTKDFKEITHHGMIFAPENKDVLIFPEKINGEYYALHRPVPKSVGAPNVWISKSNNLKYWGDHKYLMGVREGKWDCQRIGGGAVPIKTEKGWLELYHGADDSHRYCMGALLLDINDPTKIIARSEHPILEPQEKYEIEGFFGNVVFSCGALLKDDLIKMYYGISDDSIAYAEFKLQDIFKELGV